MVGNQLTTYENTDQHRLLHASTHHAFVRAPTQWYCHRPMPQPVFGGAHGYNPVTREMHLASGSTKHVGTDRAGRGRCGLLLGSAGVLLP